VRTIIGGGNAEAQFNLAGMYAKGYGVMIDDKEAIRELKRVGKICSHFVG